MARFIIRVGDRYWKDSSRSLPYPWTFDSSQAYGYERHDAAQEVVYYWNRVHYYREMIGADKKPMLNADGSARFEWSSIGGHFCRGGAVEEVH